MKVNEVLGKGRGRAAAIAALLAALGLLLALLGSGSGETNSASVSDDERVAELCSRIEGVGECYAYLHVSEGDYGSEGGIAGITVVCEGGDSAAVRERLSSMLSSLFGIGSNRIRVEKLENKKAE